MASPELLSWTHHVGGSVVLAGAVGGGRVVCERLRCFDCLLVTAAPHQSSPAFGEGREPLYILIY
jgi:hypothetical protein